MLHFDELKNFCNTTDNQREAELRVYFEKIAELLLEKNLRDSLVDDEVRNIARVRTRAVLRRLDAIRQAYVIQSLQDFGLISKDKSIVSLNGADLREASLSGANLTLADLSRANLEGAIGVTVEELKKQAASLEGAIMPDGSIHP